MAKRKDKGFQWVREDQDGESKPRIERAIRQGEELRYSYGEHLCRERALLVYGFVLDGMPACKGM